MTRLAKIACLCFIAAAGIAPAMVLLYGHWHSPKPPLQTTQYQEPAVEVAPAIEPVAEEAIAESSAAPAVKTAKAHHQLRKPKPKASGIRKPAPKAPEKPRWHRVCDGNGWCWTWFGVRSHAILQE